MSVRRAQKPKPGDIAPEFRILRLDGGEVILADIIARGPALLAFFKISCPVCQLTFPFLERIHVAGNLPICGISQNDAASTREFNRNFGVTFPILLDPDRAYPASNAYGITSVPTLFLVEGDGTIARVIEGWSKRDILAVASNAGVNPFHDGEFVPEWKSG